MKVIYCLEHTQQELDELDKQYPGGFASANLPSLQLTVEIEGTTEQVKKVIELLRTKYRLN